MSSLSDDDSVSYTFGAYRLDIEQGALLKDKEEVKLRPQAFEVLRILIARRGKLVTREELHTALWGQKVVTDDSLGHCLIDIRKALGDSEKRIIRTVPRRGYIFTPPDTNPTADESTSEDLLPKPFSAYTDLDPYIFVAYSHKDLSIIYPELEKLNNSGINVWYDEGLEAGTDWSEEIASRIKHSVLFLYFVTPDSVASQNCKNELNYALKNNIPTLIVHLKKTDLPGGLSLSLSTHQAILKHEMTDQEYRIKLEHRIAVYMDHTSVPIASVAQESSANTRAMWLGLATVVVLALGYLGYVQWGSFEAEVPAKDQTEIHEMAIAILPLTTKGKDASAQFYATELVDNLRSQFRRISGVSVRAQTSSQAVLSAGYDLPTIAKKLNVQHIILGSLELQGSELAISLSVVDESGNTHWTRIFRTTPDDIETVEVEIANTVAQHLDVMITPKISKRLKYSKSQLRNARKHIARTRTEHRTREGNFAIWKSAIAQDPNYAPMYVELAKAYAFRCHDTDDRGGEDCDFAMHYAEAGLKLDPHLSQAYAVLAFTHAIRYEYRAAQAALDKSMQLPGQEMDYSFVVWTYINLGRLQLVWDSAQIFYQHDPLHFVSSYFMSAWGFHLKGPIISERYERIMLELYPPGIGLTSFPGTRKHRVDMITAIERARFDLPTYLLTPAELAESWVRPHYEPAYTPTALAEFRAYLERGEIRPGFFFQVLLFFYQTDEAMELAFELYDQRALHLAVVWLHPQPVREFRSHPRFIELMEYIGIAAYWDDVGWPHFCEKRGGSYFCGLDTRVQ